MLRCLRTWAAVGESASEFLANWTPIHLPEPAPYVAERPAPARRKPTGGARATAWRTAQRPAPPVAPSWTIPLAAAGSAEELRAHYPLVSALLAELAELPGGGRTPVRTQQRG